MEPSSEPNTYQVAGVDERDRGFSRQAEMRHLDGQYQAIFRYEKFLLKVEPQATEQAAIALLIAQLHERSYTQLRSRVHFRGEQYLGNQEIWDEHPDPEPPNLVQRLLESIRGFWAKASH